jgi:hypothetical protein
MGPNRAWRRHPVLSTLDDDNVFDALSALQHKHDVARNVLKVKIQDILGDETPVWLKKAGRSGLKKLVGSFQQSPELMAAVKE